MAPPFGERTNCAQAIVGAPSRKASPSKSTATTPLVPTPAPAADAARLGGAGLSGDRTEPAVGEAQRLRMDVALPQASPSTKSLPLLGVAALTDGDSTPRALAEDASAPTTAATSAASSGLNSPLAAFAAARARLARSTRDADCLLHSTLAALDGLHPHASAVRTHSGASPAAWPEEASERGSSRGSSLASTPRRPPLAPVLSSGAAPSGSAVSAVAALHQRNLRLRERMSTTMALCHTLHEQNRESMEKVAQLCSSKQRLSKSLQDARLDKEGLQSTIRQLTAEAALLAEQARRALLPSAAPSPRSVSDCLEQRVQQQGEQPVQHEEMLLSARGVSEAQELGTEQQHADGEQPVKPKHGDEPAEHEEPARPQRAKVQVQPGQPGEQQGQKQAEQSEEEQAQEQAETSTTGVSELAAAAAAYVQAGGGSGDKRRRVTPALLLDVQRSDDSSAGEEGDEAEGGASGPRCRLPTPGATPKRKLRRSSTSGGTASTGAGAVHDATPAAAEDPAVEPPAAATAATGAELQDLAAAQQQGDPAGPAIGNAVALVPAEVPASVAVPSAAAHVVEEQEWETFQLFHDKWFGSHSCSSTTAVVERSPRSLSRPSRSGGGCAIM